MPVQIVLPRRYNPDNTQIEISCATVPASVPRDGEGLAKLVATAPAGTQSPAGYQLKTPGIRLWRCPPADRASGVNVPAGDYVPMGCKIAWNDLSKAPTYYRMATLYLEFVDDRADNTAAAAARGWKTHLFDGADGWAARLVILGLLPETGRKAG